MVGVPAPSPGSAVPPSAVSDVPAESVVPSAAALSSAASVVVDGVVCGLAGVASVMVAAAEKDNNLKLNTFYFDLKFIFVFPLRGIVTET